jgi:hypothetical protein
VVTTAWTLNSLGKTLADRSGWVTRHVVGSRLHTDEHDASYRRTGSCERIGCQDSGHPGLCTRASFVGAAWCGSAYRCPSESFARRVESRAPHVPFQSAQGRPPATAARSDVFKCGCCGFYFVYDKDGSTPEHCNTCIGHYPRQDESTARTIERLMEHDGRWRKRVADASEKATDYEGRMRSALRSRDLWRRTLVEIIVAHEPLTDGSCCCGAGGFPCVTRRQLEVSNRGIARQVETLEGLSEEELEKFMRGDDGPVSDWD